MSLSTVYASASHDVMQFQADDLFGTNVRVSVYDAASGSGAAPANVKATIGTDYGAVTVTSDERVLFERLDGGTSVLALREGRNLLQLDRDTGVQLTVANGKVSGIDVIDKDRTVGTRGLADGKPGTLDVTTQPYARGVHGQHALDLVGDGLALVVGALGFGQPKAAQVGLFDRVYVYDADTQAFRTDRDPTQVEISIFQPELPHARLTELRNFLHPANPGVHSVLSPVPGARSHELNKVLRAVAASPALAEFAGALYKSENILLIPERQAAGADLIANRIYERYVAYYAEAGVTPSNAVAWKDTRSEDRKFVPDLRGLITDKTLIQCTENRRNTWNVWAAVESTGYAKEGHYLPPAIVAVHEFMHVEETAKGSPEKSSDPGLEVLTTLRTLMLVDEVNKQLGGVPLENTVDYGVSVRWQGHSLPVGQLANEIRALERLHGGLADAVTSPEFTHLVEHGPGNAPSP